MGLLDEAIKQHLDLKRRRGADPSEIERLEREALGPVRRVQPEASAEDSLPAGEPDDAYEYGEEPYEEDDFAPEGAYEPADEEPKSAAQPTQAAARRPLDPDESGGHGVPPPHGDATLDDLSEPDDSGPAEPDHNLNVETAEYDVHAEQAGEPGEGKTDEGDMLEETPEFFQDAPDHDRLWFEQRPPKDFDFEG
jgi:hypothetical protein